MISVFIDTCTNHLILGIYKDKKQLYLKKEEVKNDLSSKVLCYLKNSLELFFKTKTLKLNNPITDMKNSLKDSQQYIELAEESINSKIS